MLAWVAASIALWLIRQHGQGLIQFSSIAACPSSSMRSPNAAAKPSGASITLGEMTAPPIARCAACTPAAAAIPTCSDLPSDPNAARRPPACSSASRIAVTPVSSSGPSSRTAVTAAPAAPQTAVGCHPPSYSRCERESAPIASKPAA